MKLLTILLLSILFINCKSVPNKKINQFSQPISYEVENDSLIVKISNPLKCPLRTEAGSKNLIIKKLLVTNFPILLLPESDTIFKYPVDLKKEDFKISWSSTFGNPADELRHPKITLPFPKGKTYKIIQGYNGAYSHTSAYSRYAIDFNLNIGDTVSAADDGFVVGVIADYKDGGDSRKWQSYANYITLFHPHSNLYTQYVHLLYKGCFVTVGDKVEKGQPIGLSGMTGFTNRPHLHFNVLKATNEGMVSEPIAFEEGFNGNELKEGKKVKK